MDKTLYAAMILGTLSIVYAIYLSVRKNNITGYEFVVHDTKTILLETILCLGLGYGLCIAKLNDPSLGGEGIPGYLLCAILGLVAILIGAYTIGYCFCSKIYVYEDKMIVSKVLSGPYTVYWDDIEKVEQPGLQKAAKFTCKDVNFTISGANKQYAKFMTWIRVRLKGKTGKKLLLNVEKNLSK